MNDRSDIQFSSRLLGKVARGVDLPLNPGRRTISRQEEIPGKEIEWEGEPLGDLPGKIFSGFQEPIRYNNEGLGKADEFPLPEIEKSVEISETPEAMGSHLRWNDAETISNLSVSDSDISKEDEETSKIITEPDSTEPDSTGYLVLEQGIVGEIPLENSGHAPDESDYHPFHANDFQAGKFVEPDVLKPLLSSYKPVSSQPMDSQSESSQSLDSKISPGGSQPEIQRGNHPSLNHFDEVHTEHFPMEEKLHKSEQEPSERIHANKIDTPPELKRGGPLEGENEVKGEKIAANHETTIQRGEVAGDFQRAQQDTQLEENSRGLSEQGKPNTIRHSISENTSPIKKPTFKRDGVTEKDTLAIKEVQGTPQGSIKIGQINIAVKGRQKAEEEQWPEAPKYTDHIITEDWEWSCLYARQE